MSAGPCSSEYPDNMEPYTYALHKLGPSYPEEGNWLRQIAAMMEPRHPASRLDWPHLRQEDKLSNSSTQIAWDQHPFRAVKVQISELNGHLDV